MKPFRAALLVCSSALLANLASAQSVTWKFTPPTFTYGTAISVELDLTPPAGHNCIGDVVYLDDITTNQRLATLIATPLVVYPYILCDVVTSVKWPAGGLNDMRLVWPIGQFNYLFDQYVVVDKAMPSLTVNLALGTRTYGQPISMTANLPADATGTVTFAEYPNMVRRDLATGTLVAGSASFTTSTLSAGPHTVAVIYSGDTNYQSAFSATFTITILQATTTTALTVAPNSAAPGQFVTLTANVSPADATGTVAFLDGANQIASATLSNGTAVFSTSSISLGNHLLTASYGGDTNYKGSISAAAALSIAPVTTTTALTAAPNPASPGQSVTLNATVTPSAAAGTITFFDGANQLGTAALTNGTTSFATNTLASGSHSLTASYGGSAAYLPSISSPVPLTVNPSTSGTTTALTASPNPALPGQTITLTAAVTPATSTGAVKFFDGPNQIGSGTLASGSATFSTNTLTAGTHSVTASYSGDGTHTASTSLAVSVSVSAAPPAQPMPVSISPTSGANNTTNFTLQYSHPNGYTNLGVVNLLINNFLDGRQACYLAYVLQTQTLVLVDDLGEAGGPYAGSAVLGSSSTIQNSQCTVGLASATGSGNVLTLVLSVSFKSPLAGNRIAYLAARDQGAGNSGWQALGVWQVPFTPPGPIAVSGVIPARNAAASGTGQSLSFVVSDSKGVSDLGVVNVLINDFINGKQACYLAYVSSTNTLLLIDDAGEAAGPYASMVLNGGTGMVQNSQCAVSATGSSAVPSGTNLLLTLNVTFKAAFTGNRVIYAAARDHADANNTDWQAAGTSTVQ